MTKASFYNIICLLCLSLVIYYSLNVYLMNHLQSAAPKDDVGTVDRIPGPNHAERPKSSPNSSAVSKALTVQNAIVRKSDVLRPVFRNRNPKYVAVKHELVSCFQPKEYNITGVWKIANSWPKANEVFPAKEKNIGAILNAIRSEQIRSVRNSRRGTQLKLVLELTGSQFVLFKPSWYQREEIINGTVYSGKDRHNSEIVSFHLGAILNLRSTPIVVGRKISLHHMVQYADEELRRTMPVINNRQCAYGTCHYCKSEEMVCDDPVSGMLEGAVLYTVPGKIVKYRSPWQRTYNAELKAEWEKNDNYCVQVRKRLPFEVLLDLIDAAIFDFLIQNGDRHHYETREERLLLLDNGKGFGNPFVDHMDILAPVYQCCFIRRTTWERLLTFSGGALTETLQEMNKLDLLNPLLTKEHYTALERRLLYVYSTVELCREKYGNKVFK